ncbi:unnamed protein product [Lepeophtheirus salmonis]|uniref:(salmon louse) hypothetical protein n=1 Tax=Lepeophtheirus salmonis TaxID=72036 RepID=A0A817FAX1_LEPSM|nr:unnamed protein product [Lepeophtheirus salmonis]CAG9476534.1 unnamed protein product [Lepeophtheirus salmonis]
MTQDFSSSDSLLLERFHLSELNQMQDELIDDLVARFMAQAHDNKHEECTGICQKLSVDERRIKLLLDLGANVNILPCFLVRKSVDRRNAGSIKVFGGGVVPTKGSVTLHIKYNGSSKDRLQVLVTDAGQPILGFKSCINLELVSVNNGSSCFLSKSTTSQET